MGHIKYFLFFSIFFSFLPSKVFSNTDSHVKSRIIENTKNKNSKASISFENLDKIKKSQAETFKTGVFITNIHDINHADQEFKLTFWIWFLHSKRFKNPIKMFEITNSKSFSIFNEDHIELSDGRILSIGKISATIVKNWQLNNYPFDSDKLEVHIEVSGYGGDTIRYIPDCKNSVLDEESIRESLNGWKVEKFDLPLSFKTYDTNFGNPESSYENFSRITPTLYIKRDWIPEFIRYFSVLYLSMLFATLSLFVRRKNTESKVNLIAIAVGSIMVSKFVVTSTLPSSTGFSLYGNIENFTLGFILITTLVTLLPDFFKSLTFVPTKRFRRIYLISSLGLYALINVVYISSAYHEYNHAFDEIKESCKIEKLPTLHN